MKQFSRLATLSLALLSTAFAASPKEQLETAKQAAAKAKKDVMMVFSGAPWHRPSADFAEKVLATEDFKKGVTKLFVPLVIPVPQKREEAHNHLLELEQEYRFRNFPGVILTDQWGRPYAYTTSTQNEPGPYLDDLSKLHKIRVGRDKTFDKAMKTKGLERAELLIKGLKALPQDIIRDFYAPELTLITEADPEGKFTYVEEIQKAEKLRQEKARFNMMMGNQEYDKVIETAQAEGAKLKGEDAQRLKLYEVSALFRQEKYDAALTEVAALKKMAPESELGKQADQFTSQIKGTRDRKAQMAEAAKNPKPRKPIVSKPVAIVSDINALKKDAKAAQDDLAKILTEEETQKKLNTTLAEKVKNAEAALNKLRDEAKKAAGSLKSTAEKREKLARRAEAMKDVVANHEAMEKRKRDIAELEKRAAELQKQADDLRKKADQIKAGKS